MSMRLTTKPVPNITVDNNHCTRNQMRQRRERQRKGCTIHERQAFSASGRKSVPITLASPDHPSIRALLND